VTLLIVLWSTGEHIMLPVRSTLAMNIAKEGKAGRSLGFVTGATNAGNVIGSVMVAAIFYIGMNLFHASSGVRLYNVVWGVIAVLLIASFICIARFRSGEGLTKRPRLYFSGKYGKFYALELFYGARKQIFLTFAPYVLIRVYGMDTTMMAVLMGACALINIFCAPLIGRLTDYLGYKNIMIYDTVILFFVCLMYGYADRLFAADVAYIAVCINFLLDAVISTTSMATSMYVREISDSAEETTASLTTGISINHLISIFAALAGGLIWEKFGFGVLFSFVLAASARSSDVLFSGSPRILSEFLHVLVISKSRRYAVTSRVSTPMLLPSEASLSTDSNIPPVSDERSISVKSRIKSTPDAPRISVTSL